MTRTYNYTQNGFGWTPGGVFALYLPVGYLTAVLETVWTDDDGRVQHTRLSGQYSSDPKQAIRFETMADAENAAAHFADCSGVLGHLGQVNHMVCKI